MNNVFICGGHTGYLAERFSKTNREKPEDISDFVFELSDLPQESFVIIEI